MRFVAGRRGAIAPIAAYQSTVAGGGGGSLTWAQTAAVAATVSAKVATATAVALGTASSDRYIVVSVDGVYNTISPGTDARTLTVGGTSLTALSTTIDTTNLTICAIYGGFVTSGTTGNIVLTSTDTNGSPFGASIVYCVGSLTGSTTTSLSAEDHSKVHIDTSLSSGTITGIAQTIPTGGIMIVNTHRLGGTVSLASLSSGLVSESPSEYDDGTGNVACYFAHSNTTGSLTPAVTNSFGYGQMNLAQAVLQP